MTTFMRKLRPTNWFSDMENVEMTDTDTGGLTTQGHMKSISSVFLKSTYKINLHNLLIDWCNQVVILSLSYFFEMFTRFSSFKYITNSYL